MMNDLKIQSEALNIQLKTFLEEDSSIKAAILNNPNFVRRLLQDNVIDELKTSIAKKKAVMRYDFQKEAKEFLNRCELRSYHTAKAYRYALCDFFNWVNKNGIESPLDITPDIADTYIYDLRLQNKSAATIRQRIGGLSAFFNSLERKSNFVIKNCFKGTRALPKRQAVKQIESELPTENLKLFKKDIMTIIDNESCKDLQVMINLMAFRGLRAGSFQNMTFHGNKFFSLSKGKEISGELPITCLNALKKAGLKKSYPFKNWCSSKVSSAFQYHIGKLYANGMIAYKYSAHDLRHYYALSEYSKHKDIYALKNLLNHCSISTTEIYLRGFGVVI